MANCFIACDPVSILFFTIFWYIHICENSESTSLWVTEYKTELGSREGKAIKPLFPLQIFKYLVMTIETLHSSVLATCNGNFLK